MRIRIDPIEIEQIQVLVTDSEMHVPRFANQNIPAIARLQLLAIGRAVTASVPNLLVAAPIITQQKATTPTLCMRCTSLCTHQCLFRLRSREVSERDRDQLPAQAAPRPPGFWRTHGACLSIVVAGTDDLHETRKFGKRKVNGARRNGLRERGQDKTEQEKESGHATFRRAITACGKASMIPSGGERVFTKDLYGKTATAVNAAVNITQSGLSIP